MRPLPLILLCLTFCGCGGTAPAPENGLTEEQVRQGDTRWVHQSAYKHDWDTFSAAYERSTAQTQRALDRDSAEIENLKAKSRPAPSHFDPAAGVDMGSSGGSRDGFFEDIRARVKARERDEEDRKAFKKWLGGDKSSSIRPEDAVPDGAIFKEPPADLAKTHRRDLAKSVEPVVRDYWRFRGGRVVFKDTWKVTTTVPATTGPFAHWAFRGEDGRAVYLWYRPYQVVPARTFRA